MSTEVDRLANERAFIQRLIDDWSKDGGIGLPLSEEEIGMMSYISTRVWFPPHIHDDIIDPKTLQEVLDAMPTGPEGLEPYTRSTP